MSATCCAGDCVSARVAVLIVSPSLRSSDGSAQFVDACWSPLDDATTWRRRCLALRLLGERGPYVNRPVNDARDLLHVGSLVVNQPLSVVHHGPFAWPSSARNRRAA